MSMTLRMLTLIAAAILCLNQVAFAQTPTPICEAKADANGDCVADALNAPMTVEGVVVAWKQFGTRGPGAIWDPATDCCLSIFDITGAPDIAEGELVRVTGWLGSFAGLAEIVDNPNNGQEDPIVVDLGAGQPPVATLVNAGDLADGSAQAEAMESCLIAVCGTFADAGGTFGTSSANYAFVGDDGETCTIRIDSDTGIGGTPIPAGQVTVTGILGQFDGFNSDCSGYQVLPRSLGDLAEGSCATPVETTTWGQVKSVFSPED